MKRGGGKEETRDFFSPLPPSSSFTCVISVSSLFPFPPFPPHPSIVSTPAIALRQTETLPPSLSPLSCFLLLPFPFLSVRKGGTNTSRWRGRGRVGSLGIEKCFLVAVLLLLLLFRRRRLIAGWMGKRKKVREGKRNKMKIHQSYSRTNISNSI